LWWPDRRQRLLGTTDSGGVSARRGGVGRRC